MDVAKLQLTIDGRPAVAEINAVHAALAALPAQATAAANQVTAALAALRTAAAAVAQQQQQANQTTAQAASTSVNYTQALTQMQAQLSLVNTHLGAMVSGTTQLNASMTALAAQTRTVNGGMNAAVGGTNTLNVSLGSTLRTVGALIGVEFGAAALREFVVGAVQADIAMQRMTYTLEAVQGGTREASETLGFLREESKRIGVSFVDAAGAFAKFSAAAQGTSMTQEQLRRSFIVISEAAQRLHLSGEETGRVFLALEQMVSKGVVSMEELRRQLGNALPAAFPMAAASAGKTTEEFGKLVKEGRVVTEDFLPAFIEKIHQAYSAGDSVNSTIAELTRLKNAWFELSQAIGEAARPATKAAAVGGAGILENIRAALFPRDDEKEIQSAIMLRGMKRMAMLPTVLAGYRPSDFDEEDPQAIRLRNQTLALDAERAKKREFIGPPAPPRAPREDADDIAKADRKLVEYLARENEGYIAKMLHAEASFQAEMQRNEKLQISDERRAKLKLALTQSYEGQKTLIVEEELKRQQELEDKAIHKAQEEEKERIKNIHRAEELYSKLDARGGANQKEENIARINAQYERTLRLLDELAEHQETDAERQGYYAMKAVEDRDRELAQNEALFRRRFIGEGDVLKLLERRKTLELELLAIHQEDPEGALRAKEIQSEIRDLNQTIALQFQTGGVKSADAFIFGFKEASLAWGNEAQRMANIGQGVAQSLESNFTNAFHSMLLGQKSVSAGFHEMANSIISDIARIIIQQSISVPIANAVMGAFSAGFGGAPSGTVTTATASYAPGSFGGYHIGGVVGMGGDTRTASMANFAFAPRYHSGGIVGDEVPIVARKGEVVFTPEQMAALGKAIGGGAPQKQTKVEIVNAFDETEVDRRIAANPSIVLNVIGRNANQIRRMLA